MREQDAADEALQARLSRLFAAYRDVCPDPEAGPAFMPGLWARIDARQAYNYSFRRLSRAIITAALALSFLMGVYLARPDSHASTFRNNTYLELLAAEQNHDSLADAEIVQAVYERNR